MSTDPAARPTNVRYIILGLTVCVAVLLYLDRFCLGFVTPYIRENLRLTDFHANFLLGAFFYTYAFGQIPCGWLSDRFGTRVTLAAYLAIWSILTGFMGFANSFGMLVLFRFGCGLFEAGAYPACAGLIRRWIPYERRGLASGFVSIGGRLGGTIAPVVTAYLMVMFMPVSHSSRVEGERDMLSPGKLARDVLLQVEEGKKLPDIVQKLAPRLQKSLSAGERALLERVARKPEVMTDSEKQSLVTILNRWFADADLFAGIDLVPLHSKLSKQAIELLKPTDAPRSTEEIQRRNRLVLEVLYRDSIRKLSGDSWQPVLLIYGAIGVGLAVVFFLFYRDTPRQHFMANEAEAQLVESHEKTHETSAPPLPAGVLWGRILRNSGMWASSFVQFGTNFGWIFLGSMMPTYLERVYEVPEVERGWMSSLPFLISLPMMIFGGAWTDWMTARFGAYWGRCIPLASTRFIAASAFIVAIYLNDPWQITVVFCFFSVFSDMGLPAIWAYNLDVGKRNVGLVLGWGNMWGNLGAAVSPMVLGFVLKAYVDFDGTFTKEDARTGYNAVFVVSAIVFVVIGVISFFVDATKPLEPNEPAKGIT